LEDQNKKWEEKRRTEPRGQIPAFWIVFDAAMRRREQIEAEFENAGM